MPWSVGLASIRGTLAEPNYGVYVAGNAVSLIGTWMQRIAVGWLAWHLTESAAWLGAMAFADLCPSVVIGPFAGVLADRLSRLRIIVAMQSLAMVQATVLAGLTFADMMTPPLLFALTFLHGTVIGINQPSRLALVPSLVGREHLATAVALNSVVFNLARFIGPAVAGWLIVYLGVAWVFASNAVSFLAFLLALSMIRLAPEPPASGRRMTVLRDVADGAAYIARHPGIGPLVLLFLVVSIGARPVVELLPGFAAAVFQRDATGLAVLSSAVGIGAVVGGLWMAHDPGRQDLVRVTLSGVLGGTVAILLFSVCPWYGPAVVLVGFAGCGLVVGGIGVQTLIQGAVDDRRRGRVLSLYGITFRGGPAIGALGMGVVADTVGLWPPLAVGTAIAAVLALRMRLRWRRVAAGLVGAGEGAAGSRQGHRGPG